jgi:hypothetical protein
VSFPDYEALRFESQPAIPGSATRLMLLRRGAGVERERIVALLNGDGRFVGARRLLIELIEGTDDAG